MPSLMKIGNIVSQQRQFFSTGKTKDISFRIKQLKRLKQVILESQKAIVDAIQSDFNRPEVEAYAEIFSVGEINYCLQHIKSWSKRKKVPTGIENFPGSAYIYPEPLGVVLIISPWNYPFQLTFTPLIGAIASGNCAIIKPSEISVNTSKVIAQIIEETFDREYIAVFEGGVEVSQQILAEKFDYIFFTGSPRVGKIVMESAAKYLTPVTLELGGKNPCIVESDVRLDVAANRIAWGKFLNAGQTCLAPDYVLVHRSIKDQLLDSLKKSIEEFYGEEPAKSPDFGRIISSSHFERVAAFINNGKIAIGGKIKPEECYIAPTVLDEITWDSPVMQEEVFGPILPVLEYEDLEVAITKINQLPKPLAIYIFSTNKQTQEYILRETSSGGVCINETVMHFAVKELPFGGVGLSGMGRYHGKTSFDTFSNHKSVLNKGLWLEPKWRYAPYRGKLELFKKILLR